MRNAGPLHQCINTAATERARSHRQPVGAPLVGALLWTPRTQKDVLRVLRGSKQLAVLRAPSRPFADQKQFKPFSVPLRVPPWIKAVRCSPRPSASSADKKMLSTDNPPISAADGRPATRRLQHSWSYTLMRICQYAHKCFFHKIDNDGKSPEQAPGPPRFRDAMIAQRQMPSCP